jgi:hypothetical protein
MSNNKSLPRAGLAFSLIAIIALGFALYSALGVKMPSRDAAAATVNGVPIPEAELTRAVKAMQAGLERQLTEADKAKALKLLIDEELIVQEAVGLGLANNDRLVRKNLVQAMMRSVTSLEADQNISEPELRAFYDKQPALFASPKLVSLTISRVVDENNISNFRSTLDDGKSFKEASEIAGYNVTRLPADLPLGKVADLLGGAVTETVAQMQQGDIAGPVASTDASVFIWMTRSTGGDANFETVMETVRAEIQRRRDEAALDKYIARLRKRARIK